MTLAESEIRYVFNTSYEIIVLYDVLLRTLLLFVCSHDVGSPRPEEVITQEHSERAITLGDFSNDLVRYIPWLAWNVSEILLYTHSRERPHLPPPPYLIGPSTFRRPELLSKETSAAGIFCSRSRIVTSSAKMAATPAARSTHSASLLGSDALEKVP